MKMPPNRIAFRRLLPIAQLTLFLCLSGWNFVEKKQWLADRPNYTQWDIRTEFPRPTRLEEIIFFLNAPALMLMPFASGPKLSFIVAQLVIGGPLVVLLWFFIGQTLDRRRGLLPARADEPSQQLRRLRVFRGTVGLLGCAAVFLFVFPMVGKWWGPGLVSLGYAVWAALGAAYFLTIILSCRQQKESRTSTH